MAVLTVVLAVLVGLLWFSGAPEKVDDPEATAVVGPGFDASDAVRLEFDRNAGERDDRVVLAKREGVWHVDEPYQARADVDRVIQVLGVLGRLERGVPVEGAPSAFGLEPPAVVARVFLRDGTEHTLRFGSVAPVGYRAYLATLDGGVAAVSGNPSAELLKRVAEYRDHRVFYYDPAQVTRASIQSSFGVLEAKKSDDGWFLTGYGPVDLNALDDWLTEMLNLRVDLFLDLDHETIDDPVFQVEVETPAGIQVLQVGRDTPYGKLVLFGDGLDGVVDHGILQMLERGPSDVGQNRAFPFDATADVEVVLSGAVKKSWSPIEGDWSMPEPVLEVFQDAQYAYKLVAPPWPGPELTATIRGQGGIRVVEIGAVDAEGFRAVRLVPGGPIRVPVEELAPLFE